MLLLFGTEQKPGSISTASLMAKSFHKKGLAEVHRIKPCDLAVRTMRVVPGSSRAAWMRSC